MNYNIPILFIIFNRKDTALKSFTSIKNVRPARLFIAGDGPRTEIEREKVNATRDAILSSIDWECEVNTLFQETNLGCGQAVYTAISWFFYNVDRGIILEDDCIAETTFFKYAAELLVKYQDDIRIGMISGYNPIKLKNYPYSYIFSRFKSCWGWATWSRAWNKMDINMSWRKSGDSDSILANMGDCAKDRKGWLFKIKAIDNNYVSAWDWQWYFSLSAQNQLCIFPKENQISNIGNDQDATHTSFATITLPSKPLSFPFISPNYCVPWSAFEKAFYKHLTSWRIKLIRLLPHKLKKTIKLFISKI